MKRRQLALLFARVARRSPALAADDIDSLVYRMSKALKRPAERQVTHRSTAAASEGAKQER